MYVQNIKYYRSRHDIMLISGLNHQTSKAVEEEVVTVSCNENLLQFVIALAMFGKHLFTVWNPEEPKRVVWDIISMMFIFVQMLTIPLILAFSIEPNSDFLIFDNIMNYFFMIDVIISFQTGFYDRGNLVIDRTSIAINYLKFWFWIDVVSSFPYDSVIESASTQSNSNTLLLKFVRFLKFVKVVRLLRALKLKRIFGKLEGNPHFVYGEESLSLAQAINSLLSFLKLCLMILCIAHWCACLWYMISVWEDESYGTWIEEYNIQDEEWYVKYISALYYSVTTMITVGYGDIHPYTPPEQLYAVFFMILASGVFGYSMNTIMVLFQNQDEELQGLKDKHNVLIKYMKQKDVPVYLQSRVKNYLEWLSDSQQLARTYEQQLIENLSANLKMEIVSLINGRIIRSIDFLTKNHTEVFTYRLAFLLTEKIHGPEEFILNETEPANTYEQRCLYYLMNGQVQVIAKPNHKPTLLATLEKGSFFGEIGFFGNVPRTASIQTCDFVNLLVFSRSAYRLLADSSDVDLQFAYQLRYLIEVEDNLEILQIKCFSCMEEGHVAKYCPKMHYQINKFQRIMVIRKTHDKLRKMMCELRSKRHKHRTLQILNSRSFIQANQRIQHQISFKMFPFHSHTAPAEQDSDDSYDSIDNAEESVAEPSPSSYLKRRYPVRDSFNIEKMKNFDAFLPNNNLGQVASSQNTKAEDIINQIHLEKEKRRLKLLALLDRAFNRNTKQLNPLFPFRKKPLVLNRSPSQVRQSQLLVVVTEEKKESTRVRRRLLEVGEKRVFEKQKRENIFTRTSKQHYATMTKEIVIDSLDSLDELKKEKTFTHFRQKQFTRRQMSMFDDYLDAYEGKAQPIMSMAKFKRPSLIKKPNKHRSRTTTQFKDSQTTNLSVLPGHGLSKSVTTDNRLDPLQSAESKFSRTILENMLYLTINHQLMRSRRP